MRTTFVLETNILSIGQAAVNISSFSQIDKARIFSRVANSTSMLLDRHDQNLIIGIAPSTGRGGLYTPDAKVQHDNMSEVVATSSIIKENWCSTVASYIGACVQRHFWNMAGQHMQGMALDTSAPSRNCDTHLEAKQSNSCTTGRLAKYEENRVKHSDVIGHIHPLIFVKPNYVVTFVV